MTKKTNRASNRVFSQGLALCLLLCPAALHAQATVRVLTYNTHRDIGGTDSLVSDQGALAKVVNYLNPDVWNINEIGGQNSTYNYNTASAGLNNFIKSNLTIFGPNPQQGVNYFVYLPNSYNATDGFISNAIVSRYPITATNLYSDGLRGLEEATIAVPGTATPLADFVLHLKSSASGTAASDAGKRQTEADADKANIAGFVSAGDAVVVTGDFNETQDADETSAYPIGSPVTTANGSEPYHPITTVEQAGLSDPAPVSVTGDKDTFRSSSTNPVERIDYTLYSPGNMTYLSGQVFSTVEYSPAQLAALNAANNTSFVSTDSSNASDHLPVLSVLQINPAPEPSGTLALVIGTSLLGVFAFRSRPRVA